MGPEDDDSTCLQPWLLGWTPWPVTPVMHKGHVETELRHEGLNLKLCPLNVQRGQSAWRRNR